VFNFGVRQLQLLSTKQTAVSPSELNTLSIQLQWTLIQCRTAS